MAAFALAPHDGRLRLAGMLALAVAVVAAVQVPPLVRQHELTDARMHDLTALGFPLQVPSLSGYHATIADASEGTLLVNLDQLTPYPGTTEIFFEIGPASGTWAAGELAMCAGPGHSRPLCGACSARGPHRWLLTNKDPLSSGDERRQSKLAAPPRSGLHRAQDHEQDRGANRVRGVHRAQRGLSRRRSPLSGVPRPSRE